MRLFAFWLMMFFVDDAFGEVLILDRACLQN